MRVVAPASAPMPSTAPAVLRTWPPCASSITAPLATELVPEASAWMSWRPVSRAGCVWVVETVSAPSSRVSPDPERVPPSQVIGPWTVAGADPDHVPPLTVAPPRTLAHAVDDSASVPAEIESPSTSSPRSTDSSPPETVKVVAGPAVRWLCTFKDPPDTVRLPPVWTLSAAWSPVFTVTVGRVPSRSISTTSPAVGKTPPDQLDAVDHRPLLSVSQNRTGTAEAPICST